MTRAPPRRLGKVSDGGGAVRDGAASRLREAGSCGAGEPASSSCSSSRSRPPLRFRFSIITASYAIRALGPWFFLSCSILGAERRYPKAVSKASIWLGPRNCQSLRLIILAHPAVPAKSAPCFASHFRARGPARGRLRLKPALRLIRGHRRKRVPQLPAGGNAVLCYTAARGMLLKHLARAAARSPPRDSPPAWRPSRPPSSRPITLVLCWISRSALR